MPLSSSPPQPHEILLAPSQGANLGPRIVTICFITHLIQQPGNAPDACFENWNYEAPVLRVGQQNYVDGVLCNSAANGITCSLTTGAGNGKGFFINGPSASRVGP